MWEKRRPRLGYLPLSTVPDEVNRKAMVLADKQRESIAAASRLDLATTLLAQSARPLLETIGEDLEVSYHAFGEDLQQLGGGDDELSDSLVALQPDGMETSIGGALERVAKTERGAPLAGVVLLTDGLDTSSRRIETTVRDLGSRGIPVLPGADWDCRSR